MVDNEEEGQQRLDVANVGNDDWRKKLGSFSLIRPVHLDGTASEDQWVFEPVDGSGRVEVSPEDVPDFVKEEIHQNLLSAVNLAFQFWLDKHDPKIRQWFLAAVRSDSPEAKEVREAILDRFFKSTKPKDSDKQQTEKPKRKAKRKKLEKESND